MFQKILKNQYWIIHQDPTLYYSWRAGRTGDVQYPPLLSSTGREVRTGIFSLIFSLRKLKGNIEIFEMKWYCFSKGLLAQTKNKKWVEKFYILYFSISISLTISDRLESGKDYQLRMTAHNSAGSTRHTYTLFADSINGANPSLIIGVGSTGRYTGWMLLAAFTITSIAMLAFLIRRRQKRVPQTGNKSFSDRNSYLIYKEKIVL